MPFTHEGFLLDEDQALKALLSGITVADERSSARPVPVRFGYGDPELVGETPGAQVTWPFVTIALLAVSEETSRAQRGVLEYAYATGSSSPLDQVRGHIAEYPIPIAIDYEITTHARSARHDRQIMARMIGDKLPYRFGSLGVDDGTVRRLDVLSGPERADRLDSNSKREYRKVWSVRVSSEIPAETLREVERAVSTNLTIISLPRPAAS